MKQVQPVRWSQNESCLEPYVSPSAVRSSPLSGASARTRTAYRAGVPIADSVRRFVGRVPRLRPTTVLILVILLGAALSTFIALRTPAWEANDEPDHMMNVQKIVDGEWYRIEPNAGYAPHQPPGYYLLIAGVQRLIGQDAFSIAPQQGDGDVANGQFSHGEPQESRDHRRLLPLRLVSVFLGVLTVFTTSRVARRLGADDWAAVAAAATVAFVPRFVFSSSFVNNDTLATALGAIITLLVLRVWQGDYAHERRAWRLPLLLGLALGALAATKLIALPMIAFVGMVGMWKLRRSPKLVAILIVAAMVCSVPVFVSNQLRYGDPIASRASVEYFQSWIPALVLRIHTTDWLIKAVGSGFLTSFWYTSGWNQFRWRGVSYVPLWGLAVLAAVGNLRRRHQHTGTLISVGLFASAAASVWVLAWNTTQFQARLAFPGLAAFGSVLAMGWQRWGAPRWMSFLLPLLGLVGTVYAINTDILGRY